MKSHLIRLSRLAAIFILGFTIAFTQAKPDIPGGTKVYGEGNRVHLAECPRLTKDPAELAKMRQWTLVEAEAAGSQLCSRCPGSKLNLLRQAASEKKKGSSKKMSKGDRARAGHLKIPEIKYDPKSTVYVDALWYRVHAADSPALILKEHKKTMTLEEADKAGYRIGESGQSGRELTSFPGYRRKHPLKKIPDDALLAGSDNPKQSRCYPGCHRRQMSASDTRKTKTQWIKDGLKICDHCIERGPSNATISKENWKKLPAGQPYIIPENWVHKPYSTKQLPSKEEIEILIQETLSGGSAIQELPFDNPVASVEQFMGMRFFFPVSQWLNLYKAYRSTGDQRVYDLLLESARHYNQLSKAYPSAAQLKASNPEGLPYLYTMAMCARITLQKAQKKGASINQKEIVEAEDFLNTIVTILKPTYEGGDKLDPKMGIPQAVANDFRSRAFNRAMNGIGTLATISVALQDLQKIKGTTQYQTSIDRYRKTVSEYIKNWFSESHLSEFDGKQHFYYPYNAGKIREVNGEVIFKRPEDGGHYSHTMQGALLIYETMPEMGINDDFMTAVANAIHYSSNTKIKRKGKMVLSGYIESPFMSKERPYGDNKGGHQYSPARDRFYMLQAFRDDMIDGLCHPLDEQKKTAVNCEYAKRLATLHAHYLKAFRKNRNIIHLGDHK